MRKILLIFLLITSITIIGCSSDSGSSSSSGPGPVPVPVPGPQDDSKRIKSIVTNGYTVYAITTDDKLYAWGRNPDGQVGNDSTENQTEPHKVQYEESDLSVKSVVTTDYDNGSTVYAITTDNKLYAWGRNNKGQVGNGDESGADVKTPHKVQYNKDNNELEDLSVKDVVTNGDTVYAITTDNKLYAWGSNANGQVGSGSTDTIQQTPHKVQYEESDLSVKSVVTSRYTVYAITTDNKLYAWGKNNYGQVGNGEESGVDVRTPYIVTGVVTVKSVVTDGDTVYAITTDNKLYAWGKNNFGQVGNGLKTNQKTPHKVQDNGSDLSVKSVATNKTVYAITTDDKLYAWGSNDLGQVGNNSTENQPKPHKVKVNESEDLSVKSVVTNGSSIVYAITTDNKLYAWGRNGHGQVGNGLKTNQKTPHKVQDNGIDLSVKDVVTIYFTVYAITEDDKLYAWGYNQYGQVGNGKSGSDDVLTPYLVTGIGTFKSVVTSRDTVYAITTDNKLYAWGENQYGQVGNGKTTNQETLPHEVIFSK